MQRAIWRVALACCTCVFAADDAAAAHAPPRTLQCMSHLSHCSACPTSYTAVHAPPLTLQCMPHLPLTLQPPAMPHTCYCVNRLHLPTSFPSLPLTHHTVAVAAVNILQYQTFKCLQCCSIKRLNVCNKTERLNCIMRANGRCQRSRQHHRHHHHHQQQQQQQQQPMMMMVVLLIRRQRKCLFQGK